MRPTDNDDGELKSPLCDEPEDPLSPREGLELDPPL